MSEPLTDKELAEYGKEIQETVEGSSLYIATIADDLFQEVRRLREQVGVERTNMLFAQDHAREQGERAEKAEDEVERLKELHERHCFEREQIAQELEAEQDRYKVVVDAARAMDPAEVVKNLSEPTFTHWERLADALAALDQQGDTEQ